MARTLKYPARCYKCQKWCDPEEEKKENHKSFLHRYNGQWLAHCYSCYLKGKNKNEKTKN
jgi:hypothetical protein